MNYFALKIYELALKIVLTIHQLTLTRLPAFEIYEEGKQIRRSSKSTKSNMVEGFVRRKYKNDFIGSPDYCFSFDFSG